MIQAPPCPVAGPPATTGRAINDDGHVVGWFADCVTGGNDHAFRWTPESGLQELDIPVDNVTRARALDINNNGDICGWYVAQEGGEFFQASFVLTGDGQFINIPAVEGAGIIRAQAINDAQQVVGWWGPPAVAFLWQNGKLEALAGTEDFHVMTAVDINESGQITGKVRVNDGDEEFAYVWDNGKTTILPPVPPNGIDSNPRALNATAHVAGRGKMPLRDNPELSHIHAYAADIEDAENLGVLAGFEESSAWNIHDNGLIVGRSSARSNGVGPGTIWHRGEIFDVNDLLINAEGFSVKNIQDIRSNGDLLTFANDSNNDVVAAILKSADPPLADITGDCEVNVFDLVALLDNWSMTDSFADIDNNCVVNVTDLLLLLSNWGL